MGLWPVHEGSDSLVHLYITAADGEGGWREEAGDGGKETAAASISAQIYSIDAGA